MKLTLPLILSGAISLAVAQSTPSFRYSCNPDAPFSFLRQPQWTCDVCGDDYLRGSAPIGCQPANATFDDIPLGPIGQYQRVNWTNFENIANDVPFVKPASKPNFAKLGAGKTGILDYNIDFVTFRRIGGFIKSFRYACALPLTSVPVPCTVTFAETCLLNQGRTPYTYRTDTTVFRYNGTLKSELAQSRPALPTILTCTNATISARSALGTPVDLYLDEVLHGIWRQRDADPF